MWHWCLVSSRCRCLGCLICRIVISYVKFSFSLLACELEGVVVDSIGVSLDEKAPLSLY